MGRKRARGRTKNNVSDIGKPATKEEDPPPNEKNQRKNSRNNAKSNDGKSAAALRLSNKPGKLTREDIMCMICLGSLFEPTTLPCNHSLCEVCFRKHIVETSLTCPICRLRLSVWCRKVMKENKLLDEPLWNRIKKQFPRLVEARTNGLDTQNIIDSDDEEEDDADSAPDVNNQPHRVLDGVLCETSGEIAAELQQMIRQHQEELDNERLRTETASASLIQQLQEEESGNRSVNQDTEERDFIMAKELQEQFQAEDRRTSTLRSGGTQQPKKSIQRNLVKEWAKSEFSPDITDLPLRNSKGNIRSSLGSNSSVGGKRSIKKPTTKKKTSTAPSQSPDVSRASQEIMNKFFSFSQNKILSGGVSGRSPEPRDPNLPCCSKSLADHDVNFSAFSPTKASGNSRLFVPMESLAIPISSFTDLENSMNSLTTEEPGTISKTPDSIKSEVGRHFRPIRCAPKTPPRRRPDGTFLPEPKLMKTTPLKPSCSALISAYIRSPLRQLEDEGDRSGRPSCATIEKRISNDSGRASDDSRSPDVDGTGESPVSSFKVVDNSSNNNARSYRKERGCPSEDYRVTPEDAAKTPENSKKRFLSDDNVGSGAKKVKLKSEPVEMQCYSPSPEKNKYLADLDDDDEEEHCSPSLLDNSEHHVPLRFDITCTQGIITIDEDDEEYKSKEEQALISFRQRAEQEAADREYAERLQRDLNGVEESPNTRNSREKYSLRSWLNPAAKPEVKRGPRVGK